MSSEFPRDEFQTKAEEDGHSTEFIQFTMQYARHLERSGLPVVFSLKHFGQILGISYDELTDILYVRQRQYGRFKLRKKRGGYREIRCPNDKLKRIQRWILRHILSTVSAHECSKGYQRGDSILRNALPHLGQDVILKVDLFRFFETITERRVYAVFRNLGYHPNLAVDLAKLCTIPSPINYEEILMTDPNCPEDFSYHEQPFLPQGTPTSPSLANLVAYHLDKRLKGLADSLGVKYSRYADDLTFSGECDRLPKIGVLLRIIRDEGFYLNATKTSVRKKGQRQLVTGLVVSGEQVRIPRKYKKDIWKHLYYAKKFGPKQHQENITNTQSSFQDWLLGRIMYVRSIEKDVGDEMLTAFNKIDWPFYD